MNLEEVKRVLSYGKEQIRENPNLFIEFTKVYDENFGTIQPLCPTCPGGFDSAFDYAEKLFTKISLTSKKRTMNQSAKFALRTGASLYSTKQHKHFTNDNLTDDDAVELLRESPNNLQNFEKFPENWEALAKAAKKVKAETAAKKEDATPPAKEVKEPVEHTKADTTKALNEKTVADLKAMAAAANLPEADYKALTKAPLIKYLISKGITA